MAKPVDKLLRFSWNPFDLLLQTALLRFLTAGSEGLQPAALRARALVQLIALYFLASIVIGFSVYTLSLTVLRPGAFEQEPEIAKVKPPPLDPLARPSAPEKADPEAVERAKANAQEERFEAEVGFTATLYELYAKEQARQAEERRDEVVLTSSQRQNIRNAIAFLVRDRNALARARAMHLATRVFVEEMDDDLFASATPSGANSPRVEAMWRRVVAQDEFPAPVNDRYLGFVQQKLGSGRPITRANIINLNIINRQHKDLIKRIVVEEIAAHQFVINVSKDVFNRAYGSIEPTAFSSSIPAWITAVERNVSGYQASVKRFMDSKRYFDYPWSEMSLAEILLTREDFSRHIEELLGGSSRDATEWVSDLPREWPDDAPAAAMFVRLLSPIEILINTESVSNEARARLMELQESDWMPKIRAFLEGRGQTQVQFAGVPGTWILTADGARPLPDARPLRITDRAFISLLPATSRVPYNPYTTFEITGILAGTWCFPEKVSAHRPTSSIAFLERFPTLQQDRGGQGEPISSSLIVEIGPTQYKIYDGRAHTRIKEMIDRLRKSWDLQLDVQSQRIAGIAFDLPGIEGNWVFADGALRGPATTTIVDNNLLSLLQTLYGPSQTPRKIVVPGLDGVWSLETNRLRLIAKGMPEATTGLAMPLASPAPGN